MDYSLKLSGPPTSVHGKKLTPGLAGVERPVRSRFKYSKSAHLPAESQRSMNAIIACQQFEKRLSSNRTLNFVLQFCKA